MSSEPNHTDNYPETGETSDDNKQESYYMKNEELVNTDNEVLYDVDGPPPPRPVLRRQNGYYKPRD